jgi:hypothetical protein
MRKAYDLAKVNGRRNPRTRQLQNPLTAEKARALIQDKQRRAVAGIFRNGVERYLDALLPGKPTYFD